MAISSTLCSLELILEDIKRAIGARLYYPALAVALTIPDICVALTFDDDEFVKSSHYAAFIDKYTTPRDLGLNGEQCYQLRGGVLHRGNMAGHAYFPTSHAVFCLPESGGSLHALVIADQPSGKTAAMFNLVRFCETMDQAARAWLRDHASDAKVIENMPRLISYRPNGLSPFVTGGPVVASGA